MSVTTSPSVNRFSIKDLENLTGIKAHTIRIWEQRFGIFKPQRSSGNVRHYDASELKSALRIASLYHYGYKISNIQKMSEIEMDELIANISDEDFLLQQAANELLESTLVMDMLRFEELLNGYIKKQGIESTIEQVVFRFLEKVGILWMSNKLSPAQEHLSSSLLYRKLAVAIDGLGFPKRKTKVLLFLPEGEAHELALMYVDYLLRKQGIKTFYLGTNTPVAEVIAASEALQPDYLYTHLTALAGGSYDFIFLKEVAQSLKGLPILVSGAEVNKKIPQIPNTTYLHSLLEVHTKVTEL